MAEINEERVADHKARLLDRYDDVERRETEFRMPDSEFPEHREYARDGYIGAAYAWIVRTPEQAPPLSASMPNPTPTTPTASSVSSTAARPTGISPAAVTRARSPSRRPLSGRSARRRPSPAR